MPIEYPDRVTSRAPMSFSVMMLRTIESASDTVIPGPIEALSSDSASFIRYSAFSISVDFSPSQPWLLASASLDRTVAIWDIRKVVENAKKPRALTVLDHGLSVTAARFSTSGSRLLTTCNDNLLRVFTGGAGEKWELRSSVKHNNHTGRYITPFQAEWVRGSDDEFLCGSLEHPRGVDVFNVDRGPQKRLDEEDCITSVVSLLAQHPTRDVLVASNASGKCFVWA